MPTRNLRRRQRPPMKPQEEVATTTPEAIETPNEPRKRRPPTRGRGRQRGEAIKSLVGGVSNAFGDAVEKVKSLGTRAVDKMMGPQDRQAVEKAKQEIDIINRTFNGTDNYLKLYPDQQKRLDQLTSTIQNEGKNPPKKK